MASTRTGIPILLDTGLHQPSVHMVGPPVVCTMEHDSGGKRVEPVLIPVRVSVLAELSNPNHTGVERRIDDPRFDVV